jgi:tRNA A-37 threonylcarbamoyl transferase component Bud32
MHRFRDISSGGMSWQVHPELLDHESGVLFGPHGLPLAEWLAAGQARLVKRGADRTVYRVFLPGIDCHLKQYCSSNARARLRDWLRPCKARIEFRHSLALAERGLPTLEVLAMGETERGRQPTCSYLVTRTMPDGVPLGAFLESTCRAWPADRQTRLRQRLADVLGELLARMHDAGVSHHDLHPGNFLLRLGPEDVPELFLIDLHAVRLGRPLDWRAARKDLVLLNRWFSLRAERSDRLRFWRAYRRIRGPQPDPVRLEKLTLVSNLRFWERQDRNCVGNGRYFRRVRRGGVAGHAVADLPAEVLDELLADPDAPFHRPDRVVLKESRSSAVVEFDLPGPDGARRVVYKRFAVTQWSDPWTALVRPTPALRSYVLGHGLRLRCLPTPRPLGVWHRHRHGLPREGYLLTEKVHGAHDLTAYVRDLGAQPAAQRHAQLRRLIGQVAALVRDLHHRRLSHRDLKAPNLLVAPAPSWEGPSSGEGLAAAERGARWMFVSRSVGFSGEDAPQVWFIDLVGVRRHGKLRRSRRVQNLARLHASFCNQPGLTRTDKLRFLSVYLRWGLRGRIGWKRWWRQIEEATREKVWRNLRNDRPLW